LVPILLQKSKIQQPRKSRECRFLAVSPLQRSVEPIRRLWSFLCETMWSLTSPHEQRTSGPKKFRPSVKQRLFQHYLPQADIVTASKSPATSAACELIDTPIHRSIARRKYSRLCMQIAVQVSDNSELPTNRAGLARPPRRTVTFNRKPIASSTLKTVLKFGPVGPPEKAR